MLSEQALVQIAAEVAKYPAEQKQSAVMGALRIAQVEKGWVSPEVMLEIAQILEMPPVAVEEVATFYNMYDLKPVGKHKITVCTNFAAGVGQTQAHDLHKWRELREHSLAQVEQVLLQWVAMPQ